MRRWGMLAVFAVAAVIGTKVLIENVLGVDLQPAATAWIAQAGAGSALAVVGLLTFDMFVPVPSSLVMVLSGTVFGVVGGTLLSLVGSMAGAWLGFELARRYGRESSARLVGAPQLAELERVFAVHGVLAVIVTRALPVAMEATSLVAGLSRMGRARFLLASLAGTTPVAGLYAAAGALSQQTGSLVPAAVILLAVGVAWLAYRRRAD